MGGMGRVRSIGRMGLGWRPEMSGGRRGIGRGSRLGVARGEVRRWLMQWVLRRGVLRILRRVLGSVSKLRWLLMLIKMGLGLLVRITVYQRFGRPGR